MTRLLLRLWDSWFGGTVRDVEAAAAAFRQSDAGGRADWKTMLVLLLTAGSLTFHQYVRNPMNLTGPVRWALTLVGQADAGERAADWLREVAYHELGALVWWAASCSVAYLVFPILLITVGFRERLRDYGTKLSGVLGGWPIYLVFVAVMVPLVYVFSAEPHFQETYPFFRTRLAEPDDWKWLLLWELAYAFQFVGLEFFFRGFVVHGTKHRFGIYSVFVMTVPYCMIHFGKPLPECVASIVAGVALGFMSLKTRSVWLGAALHISVAWGMDGMSLWRRG